MNIFKRNKYLSIVLIFLLIIIGGCVFPFTTTSYKWDIKYDKNKFTFKKNFLQKELLPYSGNRLMWYDNVNLKNRLP
jgi:hypothetical protein